ncbi:hypothetical protein [Aliiroseovarius crassostreae]|uniref:hypothetical protein n=1 Tax=Aliiroseovarius crassostreae TaxID=154981 RepID=UPI001F1E676E|nr:hypothetical protein [Aliiroseovarius crassostreae]
MGKEDDGFHLPTEPAALPIVFRRCLFPQVIDPEIVTAADPVTREAGGLAEEEGEK